jgi:acetyl-CoA carboxylase carboxyltransferase component
MRRFQSRRSTGQRLQWNRVLLVIWPPVDLRPDELNGMVRRLAPLSEGVGLEKVAVRCRIPDPETRELRDVVMEIINPDESSMILRFRRPAEAPLKPLREYARKVIDLKRRGLVYPYEIVRSLTPRRGETQADLPPGDFVEHDLNADSKLVPVDRPYGGNTANIVAGVVRSFTDRYPEGMARVILLGDPSRGMGALAEPECRRIIAGLDLAERLGVPLEWFAVSAGAKISMDSGTENMDWIALVLRRLVEFTQKGGEVNIVVPGINVGAQPYWNAEATMLMHTRGIVIMTPEGAMVLTGKQALDYSGGVSAEDNQGIGGYERIMGPNGQAQYAARDLGEACRILLRHYEHTWTAPGERFPRPAPTADPRDRDICPSPHGGDFATVGDVFSDVTNPGRKKPFEIRRVMSAVVDQDHEPLERWYGMRDAEIAVVWDAHLGGQPICLLGFESKPLPRLGFVPVYGPDHWTGGTLFPLASKKVARAINAASGNRPLVVLANLSGFDGSPESMRQWQLEYGAEIGRAVVNFKGPIVFCVVSRYHGGAFVVFSNALHDNLEVAALEGTHASVIGGAPAAAVVFAREVDQRTRKDPRIVGLEQQIADPATPDKGTLRAHLEELLDAVRSEKLGEVAEEFDHIHSVQRAQRVGSVHHILPPERLRPYLIEAMERGMQKERERIAP